MCGIIGIFGHENVTPELVFGLTALQHRGQDAAGIVTFDKAFRTKKGLGLVSDVIDDEDVVRMAAPAGIGHVRYSTVGKNEVLDAQPVAISYPLGIAMAHNGNVTNYDALKEHLYKEHHRLIETSCDLELILYTFASELQQKDLRALGVSDIFDAVTATQTWVQGAYSAIAHIAHHGFLAFADPYGLRPLVLGKRDTSRGPEYIFASETTCLDHLGFAFVRDLEAGEAIYIDESRQVHSRICHRHSPAFCVFEYIYFAREDSTIHGRLVADERIQMGRALAQSVREQGLKPDIVIDVPSSAYFFAAGLAEELGVPYRRGFSKNRHIGRSFISPTQSLRERMVRAKLNPIRQVIQGKKVAVVDDSIVRGTTSRHLVRLLRDAGAAEVYFVSASPPVLSPCVYGIDMSIRREMIAANSTVEEIRQQLGADALVYQKLEDLKRLAGRQGRCHACFSGEYPTGVTKEHLEAIEAERQGAKAP
ncbi:MAG: amidophosphoribosyltransferase [Deltaproteobacteria bacterium]|nr:amidophosphoribosyltransferase [Deltaproteobacteria bacterium]